MRALNKRQVGKWAVLDDRRHQRFVRRQHTGQGLLQKVCEGEIERLVLLIGTQAKLLQKVLGKIDGGFHKLSLAMTAASGQD